VIVRPSALVTDTELMASVFTELDAVATPEASNFVVKMISTTPAALDLVVLVTMRDLFVGVALGALVAIVVVVVTVLSVTLLVETLDLSLCVTVVVSGEVVTVFPAASLVTVVTFVVTGKVPAALVVRVVTTDLLSALVTISLVSRLFVVVDTPAASIFVVVTKGDPDEAPAEVTTDVLVLSALGAVTVTVEEVVIPPAVSWLTVLVLPSSCFVSVAIFVVANVPLGFSTTVVDLLVITLAMLDKITVVVTIFPSALVTSVALAPEIFFVAIPALFTSVTVSTTTTGPTVVTFWTSEVELSVVLVTVAFEVVVCPWASPRASTMRAALMKLMASNKY
jgi:hypothetical protein